MSKGFKYKSVMGLFNLFRKEKEPLKGKPLLGLVLLKEPQSIPFDKVITELRDKWNIEVNDRSSGNYSSILFINGYEVVISQFPFIIPSDGTEMICYNNLWTDTMSEIDAYKAHVLILIMNPGVNPFKENLLYNKLLAVILNNTDSIGVYIGSKSYLLKKEVFLPSVNKKLGLIFNILVL